MAIARRRSFSDSLRQVSNDRERASGATENLMQVRRSGDGLKIVGIRERKVRE